MNNNYTMIYPDPNFFFFFFLFNPTYLVSVKYQLRNLQLLSDHDLTNPSIKFEIQTGPHNALYISLKPLDATPRCFCRSNTSQLK